MHPYPAAGAALAASFVRQSLISPLSPAILIGPGRLQGSFGLKPVQLPSGNLTMAIPG